MPHEFIHNFIDYQMLLFPLPTKLENLFFLIV